MFKNSFICLKENILRVHYKKKEEEKEPAIAGYGNDCCLFWETRWKETQNFLNVKADGRHCNDST